MSANKAGPAKQTAGTTVGPVFKPKSLTQLAAEKLEQSIKKPAVLRKQSNRLPTLKTLAANAMVKDKIKYLEKLSKRQAPTIRLDKILVSLQNMRDEELEQAMCLNIHDIHHSKICFTIDYNRCLVNESGHKL